MKSLLSEQSKSSLPLSMLKPFFLNCFFGNRIDPINTQTSLILHTLESIGAYFLPSVEQDQTQDELIHWGALTSQGLIRKSIFMIAQLLDFTTDA